MGLICLVCSKSMGFFNSGVNANDGPVCNDCWKKAGFRKSTKDLNRARTLTGEDIKNIINGTISHTLQVTDNLEAVITAAIKSSGTASLMEKSYVRNSASLLQADESVFSAFCGIASFGQTSIRTNTFSDLKNKASGVLILTNKRIIFSSGGSVSKSFYLTDINAVSESSVGSLIGSVLRIQAGSSELSIETYKNSLPLFRQKLEDAIYASREEKEQRNKVVIQQPISGADEILKYKNLLDAGIITEEEFIAKKAQILGL